MTTVKQLWKVAELARDAGVVQQRILQLISTGRLTAMKDARGHWQIPDSSARAYLGARRARAKANALMVGVHEHGDAQ